MSKKEELLKEYPGLAILHGSILDRVCDEVDQLKDQLANAIAQNARQADRISAQVADVTELGMAVGVATSVLGEMEIDPDDPVGMMQQVVDEVVRLKRDEKGLEGCNTWQANTIQQLQEVIASHVRRNERQYLEIRGLKRVSVDLRKFCHMAKISRDGQVAQPPAHVGRIIDEQEKEITRLKAELQRHCDYHHEPDRKARRKLTEIINEVLKREYYHIRVGILLQDAVRKYGTNG